MKLTSIGRPWLPAGLLFAALAAFPSGALAHKLSDSYLTLQVTRTNLVGEWRLSLRDLEDAVGLDTDEDGAITWDELRSHAAAVWAYARSRLQIHPGPANAGTIRPGELLVDQLSDGAYALLRFTVEGAAPTSTLEVHYQALFDIDPLHRGLLRLEQNGGTRVAVFAPETATQRFDLASPVIQPRFLTFVQEGMWHIWTGYDHLLFLLALLLPGVLRRAAGRWEPVPGLRSSLSTVAKIVTAFTVAHSLTLSLAALGWVRIPPRLVEAAIAVSVVLAAANNLAPFVSERAWLVAFGFGLVHGFGFANALRDLGLRPSELAATLLGFNLGVEAGQLLIVVAFLPLAFGLRHLRFYRHLVLHAGSAAILLVAATWFAERVFDFKCLPF